VTHPILPRSYLDGNPSFWTVYWICPPGEPGEFVVREWVASPQGVAGGEVLYRGQSLEAAHAAIPDEACARLNRSPDDHPSVVETWL